MPSSYAIGDHFEQFTREQIDSGRYASASENCPGSLATSGNTGTDARD